MTKQVIPLLLKILMDSIICHKRVFVTKGNPSVVCTELASVRTPKAETESHAPLSFSLQFLSVLQIYKVGGS